MKLISSKKIETKNGYYIIKEYRQEINLKKQTKLENKTFSIRKTYKTNPVEIQTETKIVMLLDDNHWKKIITKIITEFWSNNINEQNVLEKPEKEIKLLSDIVKEEKDKEIKKLEDKLRREELTGLKEDFGEYSSPEQQELIKKLKREKLRKEHRPINIIPEEIIDPSVEFEDPQILELNKEYEEKLKDITRELFQKDLVLDNKSVGDLVGILSDKFRTETKTIKDGKRAARKEETKQKLEEREQRLNNLIEETKKIKKDFDDKKQKIFDEFIKKNAEFFEEENEDNDEEGDGLKKAKSRKELKKLIGEFIRKL